MISFDEAYSIVMSQALDLDAETVSFEKSLGRILAQDVVSDMDMPPFNKSAMDGYACRRQDIKTELTVVEEIPAGVTPKKEIGVNECAKIMTGSMVPAGADCVIMIEDVEVQHGSTIQYMLDDTKTNICYKGEDIKTGDQVLPKGSRIDPEHIAVLATVGCVEPKVSKQPRVGVISTGSELVEPSEKAGRARIRNSNGWQLVAQAETMGCITTNYGIAEDTEAALDEVIKKAIAENDVIMLSGGVSMGDYDLVPGVLQKNGIELLFNRVAIKPGRPSTFGVGDGVRVFALPGNPVSTFMQFEVLVKPFLYKMMGHEYKARYVKARMNKAVKMKKADRVAIVPVHFVAPDRIERVSYHGSAHINAMCHTDGFLFCSAEGSVIEENEDVDVRLF
jgi:molybdopterin molybdotransferase